ncbi:UDP-glucose 4-epimerase GalE [bacterium]|nr:UDP-glucose 4-epimerase GalE [bacterium]MBQ9149413.1 UDP-glucose 4-epimerase GalE [bacterium]
MILITGGAGYIGSHCVLEFIKNVSEEIVIFDNLSTGHIETIETLQKISNKIKFIEGDLKNPKDVKKIFKENKIDSIIHFAALSSVAQSIKEPQKYYENNVLGTLNLLNTMVENNVLKIVFSSTAAIYGEPNYTPIDENHPKNPINPYGKTKLSIEEIMSDFDKLYNLKSIKLRYFNVIGANSDSIIGEWHNDETHLVPNILKSTFNNSKIFEIYGDNYNTPDGTCIRDYVNVEDLALAHRLAYNYLLKENVSNEFNIGTKEGNSVKDIFNTVQKTINKQIEFKILPRRKGDPEILLANSKKAQDILGWSAKNTLETSIKTAYEWEKKLQKKLFSF